MLWSTCPIYGYSWVFISWLLKIALWAIFVKGCDPVCFQTFLNCGELFQKKRRTRKQKMRGSAFFKFVSWVEHFEHAAHGKTPQIQPLQARRRKTPAYNIPTCLSWFK